MNQFSRFKFYHTFTLLLALTFVCIKSYEYHDKFTHYEVTRKDGRFATGVLHLWHHEADRSRLAENDRQLDEVLHSNRIAARRGLSMATKHEPP